MNHITINGNLTKDTEVKILNNGTAIYLINFAWNLSKKDEMGNWTNVPNYFTAKYFHKNQNLAGSLTKGTGVVVTGKLQQETWTDKDNNKRSAIVIIADEIVISKPREKAPSQPAPPMPTKTDEDLPF